MRMLSLKVFLTTYSQYVITVVMFLVAILIIWWLWAYYQAAPWTRDGRLRADIVRVAPDVSGLVVEVYVKDNQTVQRGDKLFIIDQPRFIFALENAEAKVKGIQAALAENIREDVRNRKLGTLVSREAREQSLARTQELHANLKQAISNLHVARLNLTRSTVLAPVNGIVTNFDLQPGNYVTRGHPVFALIDSDTLRIEGYFEETKLPNIDIGNKVRIHLMGQKETICGHVESMAAGIEDRERSPTQNQLANINPTFNWVRLAQRIPVRIVLDHVPAKVRLVAGRTATVEIIQPSMLKIGHTC